MSDTRAADLDPITADNSAIEAALREAHVPTLMMVLIHLTGKAGHLRPDWLPVYEFFGDGQGDLSPEVQDKIRADALEALKAYRDGGFRLPPTPDEVTIRKMMDFIAGAEIPEHYVPLLMEELGIAVEDSRQRNWYAAIPPESKADFRVVIVGAGMSGLLAGIHLQRAGIPFTIVEMSDHVGGTWWYNTYPGCRVDNPNHLYSYSFEPFHDFPQYYSSREVLFNYFDRVADKYGLKASVRFETEVKEAVYDDRTNRWSVRVRDKNGRDEVLEANAVITAMGQLNLPKLPEIEGRDSFAGPAFHSARWDHGVDLKGKRVAVIGTGASSAQFVPEIAADTKELYVFQKTPPWLGPTENYHQDVPEGKKWLMRHVPFYAKWYRFWLFWTMTDGVYPGVQSDPSWTQSTESVSEVNAELRGLLVEYLRMQTEDDPELFEKIVPHYPPGGKRMLRDNGLWVSTLKRDNVDLITDRIARITPSGLMTEDGKDYPVDVIIYGTGFHASKFLYPMEIKGREGISLNEQWHGDARAYLGITVPNFPNLFLMYGPNTNIVVNGSIVFFSECEIRYITGCLKLLLEEGYAAMEPRRDVHDAYNEKVDAGNKLMAWGAPQVTSWYKNETGRVSQNWPFPLVDYWTATKEPNPDDYVFLK